MTPGAKNPIYVVIIIFTLMKILKSSFDTEYPNILTNAQYMDSLFI